jgi:hypothetical protein
MYLTLLSAWCFLDNIVRVQPVFVVRSVHPIRMILLNLIIWTQGDEEYDVMFALPLWTGTGFEVKIVSLWN